MSIQNRFQEQCGCTITHFADGLMQFSPCDEHFKDKYTSDNRNRLSEEYITYRDRVLNAANKFWAIQQEAKVTAETTTIVELREISDRRWKDFEKELCQALNRNSIDVEMLSDDFVLANYVIRCLRAYQGAQNTIHELRTKR